MRSASAGWYRRCPTSEPAVREINALAARNRTGRVMTNRGSRHDFLSPSCNPGARDGLRNGAKTGGFGARLVVEIAAELTHVALPWIRQRVENRIQFDRRAWLLPQ
jgi:hypothetical protein